MEAAGIEPAQDSFRVWDLVLAVAADARCANDLWVDPMQG
jgi:hypothetical protein